VQAICFATVSFIIPKVKVDSDKFCHILGQL